MANVKTATRTATTTKAGNVLDWYRDTLKAWPVKVAGSKPTAAAFETAHALGAKPGTKTAVAIAMYLRPEGATQGQVFNVNGGPYLNKMRALLATKAATRVPMNANEQGHTVYKLALPAKAATKAKAARKPKAAKADKAAPAAPAA